MGSWTLIQVNYVDFDIPICNINRMALDDTYSNLKHRVATRLKLQQLRLLVAIADQSSILHAARSLNISQPAATKLLKSLEADFGVELFERTNRGAIPTAAGAALVRHGRLILAQLSHAAQELDDLAEGTGGRVVLGTLLAASALLLPATIAAVRVDRPNVSIVIREGTNDRLIPALRDGSLDLVLGRLSDYRYREDLAQEALYEERVCVVVRSGHELASVKRLTLKRLRDWGWILPPPETTLRRQIDKEFQDAGVEPPSNAVESVSHLTNRYLVRHTDMLSIWPYHVIEEDVERGDLVILPIALAAAFGPVGVSTRRSGRLSPAATAFLETLRRTAADLGASGLL